MTDTDECSKRQKTGRNEKLLREFHLKQLLGLAQEESEVSTIVAQERNIKT